VINRKRGRKYVNRDLLFQYFTVTSWSENIPEIMSLFAEGCIATAEDICSVFRRVCYEFVRNYSLAAVLTSKRISVTSKKGHLKRIRTLERALGSLGSL
jgi:hypothetical protein